MNADQAYAELEHASKTAGPQPGATSRAPGKSRRSLEPSINRGYLVLRRWTAILAIALAPILAAASGAGLNPSISHYYFLPGNWTRDLFVGTLCAIGFVLYFYKGYSNTEDWLLSIAGIAAAGVAFFPMTDPALGCKTYPAFWWVHGAFAGTLFVMIAAVCWFTSEKTLKLLNDERRQAQFRWSYRVLGASMAAAPATIFVLHKLSGLDTCPSDGAPASKAIFFVEAAGITVFAIYWLMKSREIAEIIKQPKRAEA
ncbi:MAG: hypothetical protein RLZZ58_2196 [Pseudomonadota bacterium]